MAAKRVFLLYGARGENGERTSVGGEVDLPEGILRGSVDLGAAPGSDVGMFYLRRARIGVADHGEVAPEKCSGYWVYITTSSGVAYLLCTTPQRPESAESVVAHYKRDRGEHFALSADDVEIRRARSGHIELSAEDFLIAASRGLVPHNMIKGDEKMTEEVKKTGKRRKKSVNPQEATEAEKTARGFSAFEEIGERMAASIASLLTATRDVSSGMPALFKEAGKMSRALEKAEARAGSGDADELKDLRKTVAAVEKERAKMEARLAKVAEETEKAVTAAVKADRKAVLVVLKEEMDAVKADAELEKPWKKFIGDLQKIAGARVKDLPYPGE